MAQSVSDTGDEKPATANTATTATTEISPKMETSEYPSNQKRILIMGALYLAVFLVTLVSKQHSHGFE